jgi:hypothetical protein
MEKRRPEEYAPPGRASRLSGMMLARNIGGRADYAGERFFRDIDPD